MKTKRHISIFFRRHSIFTVFAIMIITISYMLQAIEINERVSVDVILEHNGEYYCYAPQNGEAMNLRDTILVYADEVRSCMFTITGKECMDEVVAYHLTPISNYEQLNAFMRKDRKLTGYIVTGKKKLWSMIFWNLQYSLL